MNRKQERDGALIAFQKSGATASNAKSSNRFEKLEQRMTRLNNRVDMELRAFDSALTRTVDETEHRLRKVERQLASAWEQVDYLVDQLNRLERVEQHLERGEDPGEISYRLEQLEAFVADAND